MTKKIFIPKKINVGFQERKDTYTGKLAYVTYFDERDKLRQEKSWNCWRDHAIDNLIVTNEPTEGFVLNKKVGEYRIGWNQRKAYCRVYDPRGFEFEISFENLLYILENTSCIKGKGLEGEFVYGWDSGHLILVPTNSLDYEELIGYSKSLIKRRNVRANELKVGYTYRTKYNETVVYLGRFPHYARCITFLDMHTGESGIVSNACGIDAMLREGKRLKYETFRKLYQIEHCFCIVPNNINEDTKYELLLLKQLQGKIIECIDDSVNPLYETLSEQIKHYEIFSQLDTLHTELEPVDFDTFRKSLLSRNKRISSFYSDTGFLYHISISRYTPPDKLTGKINAVYDITWYYDEALNSNINSREKCIEDAVKRFDIQNKEELENHHKCAELTEEGFRDAYDRIKPQYKKYYLTNGYELQDNYSIKH